MNNKANEFTLCGMYLERNPTPYTSMREAQHVQREMRDNWEVDLGFDEAVNILIDHDVFVYPENEKDEDICISCLLNEIVNHLTEIDERLDNLEENV